MRLPGNGIHDVAGFEFLKAFDHHAIAGVEPVEHQPLLVDHAAGAHRLDDGAVVRAHDVDLAATAVVALDRLLRNRERIAVGALLDLHAHIHARQQLALRVGKLAAQRHLPGAGIDAGIGEQQFSRQRIERSVVEHETDLGGVGLDLLERAAFEVAAQLLKVAGRLGEVGIDRIELLHGRHVRGFALADQRAFRDHRAADAAVDGRTHARIVEIELHARHVGLARGDIGLRLAERRDRDLILRLRGGLARDQLLDPLGLLFGLIVHGLRLGERGFGRRELDFELHRVDAIEHIAGLDVGALRERSLQDNSCDACAYLGNTGRRDAAGKLADVRPRRRLQGDDAHLRRSRGHLFGLRLVTCGNNEDDGSKSCPSRNYARVDVHPVPLFCASRATERPPKGNGSPSD